MRQELGGGGDDDNDNDDLEFYKHNSNSSTCTDAQGILLLVKQGFDSINQPSLIFANEKKRLRINGNKKSKIASRD